MIDELSMTQPYDQDKGHLTIEVSKVCITSVRERLRDVVQPKALFNTTRLYFFLLHMKSKGVTHIDKKDLAAMMFSKHDIRLSKAIAVLKSAGLLHTELVQNNITNRFYTNFFPVPIPCIDSPEEGTFIYEYQLTPSAYWVFEKQSEKEKVLQEADQSCQNSAPESSEPQTPVSVSISPSDKDGGFRDIFISWYGELKLSNGLSLGDGHFSDSDGRFYHRFHLMTKEERQDVRWDGEPVIEVWDAHCSFMAVLCYYLKYYKEYDNEDERKAFMVEANRMLDFIVGDDIYERIVRCYDYRIDRKRAKELLNAYKSFSRKSYFRKDGHLKDTGWARPYGRLDSFFKKSFPYMRDYFLDYPRREETDFSRCDFVINADNQLEQKYRVKSVSNLVHDIMPYEFRLISLGVCRDIFNDYGIKSITVHDAVYMREADKKRLDGAEGSANEYIARLFARRLGVGAVKSKPLF